MTDLQQTIAPKTFGATSTTDEVLEGVNLKGKRVLVTGVSAGLGVETARGAHHVGPVSDERARSDQGQSSDRGRASGRQEGRRTRAGRA
jgi:hypothetical protein